MVVQRYFFICFILGLLGLISSCTQGPNLSDIPYLEYQMLSKDTIDQSVSTDDSFVLFLHLEDGDGDIGNESDESVFNLFIIDNRTGEDYDQPVQIPKIPESVSKRGVLIDLELTLFPTCCRFPDSTIPCEPSTSNPLDSLTMSIHLVDRAGNMSNVVTTDWLYLRCN